EVRAAVVGCRLEHREPAARAPAGGTTGLPAPGRPLSTGLLGCRAVLPGVVIRFRPGAGQARRLVHTCTLAAHRAAAAAARTPAPRPGRRGGGTTAARPGSPPITLES